MYEDLIKRQRSQCQGYGKECEDCNADGNCRSQMENEAADAIEALSKMENTTRWIPVTERLPKDGKFVLVCNDDKHMMIAKYETETYEWYYKYTNYDFDIWDNEEQGPVCHWMPLPEPPKEEA